MSDVNRALDQLNEIHTRIARSHVYRGWRSVPVALSGLAGLVAAWLQPSLVSATIEPRIWASYWLATAIVAFLIGCAHLLWRHYHETSTAERRRTEEVLAQLLPALIAGAVITVALLARAPDAAALLPGIWCVCFAMGVFSARPFAPAGAVLVAIYYLTAAVVLLWSPGSLDAQSGWRVGGVFALGQLLAAAVLYWSLERGERAGDFHG